ncbi:MAG: methyltransferase domain-containing protein [Gammaproteobacteria bacterium]|nr:methyltransferase domain-containing protein [Gammaproteobacteria bacterium]NIR83017.1 methyltransferase domain-containing protein [Gammaproteobacteria bacterium]NIR90684.1 methyltransferase domain-containing protein [Gammaproteobacteria bacterium]NIU04172.1 methyltransferase domain-containing protein [Gammaproteobacteria bacterium]NIV51463.1 methyltransferase domain-containing protein [Gammaproteobacteria bacterium]
MDKDRVRAFTQEVFRDMAGAMTAGLAYVGVRTGLFRVMAGKGPLSVTEVVEASGLEPRYVEEWLQGMSCAGYLEYEPEEQTYRLPEEHAYLLASDGTDHFAGGLYHMAPALLGVAPRVAEAFEMGGGVPFEAYGEEGVRALDLINRGNYENRLVGYWLPKLPNVVQRLEQGAWVLDVGCGVGRVPLALARAFPRSRYLGLDLHAESVRAAQRSAEREGLSERVRFVAGGIESVDPEDGFDFITACDCVHDFARPLETLREIRRLLKPDGTLLVVEPKVADRLEDNRNPIATMFYGFSVFHCMTQSLAAGGPGLGTCMGPARTEALMREAGFGRFEILDIKSAVNLFYAVAI